MADEAKFIEWRPEWSAEDEAQISRATKRLDERISAVRALRELLGLSQAELSELLSTTQSNVSKIEARADPRLSVLRRMIEGKGGRLRVIAEFGDRKLEVPL